MHGDRLPIAVGNFDGARLTADGLHLHLDASRSVVGAIDLLSGFGSLVVDGREDVR